MYVSTMREGVCFHLETSVNNFHVGPQVKMQIAAELKGRNAESNAEDYAHDDNIYSEATVTPDTDPDEG